MTWFDDLLAEADSAALAERHEEALALLEEALTLAGASDEVAPIALLEALASRAYQLVTLGLWQRAVVGCDELLALASEVRDRRARRLEAWALLEKAGALSELEQDEASLAELKPLFDRYGATRNQTIRLYISVGLEREAAAYRRLGATAQELKALQQLSSRFGRSTEPDIERRVSFALYRQAWLIDESGSERKALARYRAFAERVGGTTDELLLERWVSASGRSARLLARRGRTLEALAVLDGAVEGLEAAGETDTRDWAKMMLTKAQVLWEVQRGVEALAVLDAITERLAGAGDVAGRKLVAVALAEKVSILVSMGYQTQADREIELLDGEFAEPALAAIDERISRLSGTTDPAERLALGKALLTKARILNGLGRGAECDLVDARLAAVLEHDDAPEFAVVLGGYAGFLSTLRNEPDRAQPFYERALAAGPANANVLNDYAVFLTDVRGDYDRAEELYERAIAANPTNASFLGNYANFLTDVRGDHDRAQQLYERAIAADPAHANNLCLYALFLTDVRGEHDRAQELYERAIAANPNDVDHLTLYAIFLDDVRGDYERVRELYKRAIALDPANANVLALYANLLVDALDDHDRAEELFARAVAADPTDATVLGNYARLLFERHKDAQAISCVQRALENAADDDDDLRAELFFYLAAVGPSGDRESAQARLEALLDAGVRSPGWDLSRILARARHEDPSRAQKLEELADRLTSSDA